MCPRATLMFTLFLFAAILKEAFADCVDAIRIRFRTDGGLYNLSRLRAKAKVRDAFIRELLYADNCAPFAHSNSRD